DLANRSVAAGRSGAAAAEAAVCGIDDLRQRMEIIAARAETLDSRSREIYSVLTLITEIAQETHILSLNAAIEASAAGEYGDRFAVVAQEVRRLAERSKESVENIRTLLDEFTGAISAVVFATEEGMKSSDEAATGSRSTAEAIEQLSGALAETALAAQEISLATQEQQAASNEVVLTVKEESDVIQRMAEGLIDFTSAAERLNQLALSIQLLSQSFRLNSVHSLKNLVMEMAENVSAFSGNIEAVEGVFREVFGRCAYLEMAYLVDVEGGMIAFATNQELIGEHKERAVINVGQVYSDRPWFQAVGRDSRTAVTPIYDSLLTGDNCFTVAAVVINLQGKTIGTLGIDVNVRNWTRI
ncbi:MAG: hypothetical protein K8R59_16315, partial [Thermoanaerobaculales bacterium]|nr:hypothetical protein [Thermoanaerobaculales bacterium]